MTATVYIDGVQMDAAIEGSSTRRLNRPSQASIKMPMDVSDGDVGSLLKIELNGDLHHHGRVLSCQVDSGEDDGYVTLNSVDPMEMWQWRPARDPDGDFSKPDFISTFITGPQIMESILDTSNDGTDPATGEGPLFIEFGTFETGGVDLSGAPTDWPMTIAEIATLLTDTGELDIVLTPIDSGGNLARIDCYNGDYGTDLSGSVIFEYAMGANNVRSIRWNRDITNMCNKLWYYGGPRVLTQADPAGDQHWCFNIQGDDPGLATPPGGDTNSPYTGGHAPGSAGNPLGQIILDSRSDFGVRMDIKIFDAESDNCRDPAVAYSRELYRRLWQIEAWLRAQPHEIVHITPTRETAIGDFDIGDLVRVRAGSRVRGGFDGVQRIYQYTVSWDTDGVLALSELQTSPSQEGFG